MSADSSRSTRRDTRPPRASARNCTPVVPTPPSSCGSAASGSTRKPRCPPARAGGACGGWRRRAGGARVHVAARGRRPGRAAGGAARWARGARRDYGGACGVAGYGPRAVRATAPPRASAKRAWRSIASSRCAASCGDAAGAVVGFRPPSPRAPGRRERRRAEKDFDRALDQRLRESGHAAPRSRDRPPGAASAPAMSRPTARLGPIHRGAPAAASSPRCCATPTRSRGGANASWGADGGATRGSRGIRRRRRRTRAEPRPSGRRLARGSPCWRRCVTVTRRSVDGPRRSPANRARPKTEAGGYGISALARAEIPPEYLRLYLRRPPATGSTGRSSRESAGSSATTGATPRPRAPRRARSTRRARAGRCSSSRRRGRSTGWTPKAKARPDRWNPADAIFGAANYLRASGAPGNYREAIYAYNHAGGTWKRSRAGRPSTAACRRRRSHRKADGGRERGQPRGRCGG